MNAVAVAAALYAALSTSAPTPAAAGEREDLGA